VLRVLYGPYAPRVRDIETIDGELRLLSRAWRVAREMTGRTPSTVLIDRLLDERSATMVLSTTVAGGCMAQTTTQLGATNRGRNCAR
jgi:hypothetical protein